MKTQPFDAPRHDDSDDMCYMFLRSLDGEIFAFNDHVLELSTHFWQAGVCDLHNM